MATANEVLNQARSELGYAENPRGSNKTKFASEAGHANGYAWCATYVVAMFRRCGIRLPSESAYTPTMAGGFKSAGTWHTGTPLPGDVVFFIWPNMGRISHVGIVETAKSRNDIYTIEGNTDEAGGRTGGKVMRQHRTRYIAGYGRPVFAPSNSTEEEELMAAKDEIIASVNQHTTVSNAYQAQSHRVVGIYNQLHRFEIDDAGDLRHQFYDPAVRKWLAESLVGGCDPNGKVDVIPEYNGAMHVFADSRDVDKVVHLWYNQKGGWAIESIPR